MRVNRDQLPVSPELDELLAEARTLAPLTDAQIDAQRKSFARAGTFDLAPVQREGSFTPDFRNDMSRERSALEYAASPAARRNALTQPQVFTGEGDDSVRIIMPDVLAMLINEAVLVGRGRVALKNLAERLERFGVRRKA